MSETKQNKKYFPIFVDLSEKHIVVIGAGKIAARRIASLREFAGKMTVVAPEIREEILAMAGSAPVSFRRRFFEESDLEGADLALAVTDDKELNRKIGTLCRERNIPVNVSHDKDLCDFYFPGLVQKDSVVIGVTASGKDHTEARKVTERIRAMLREEDDGADSEQTVHPVS